MTLHLKPARPPAPVHARDCSSGRSCEQTIIRRRSSVIVPIAHEPTQRTPRLSGAVTPTITPRIEAPGFTPGEFHLQPNRDPHANSGGRADSAATKRRHAEAESCRTLQPLGRRRTTPSKQHALPPALHHPPIKQQTQGRQHPLPSHTDHVRRDAASAKCRLKLASTTRPKRSGTARLG